MRARSKAWVAAMAMAGAALGAPAATAAPSAPSTGAEAGSAQPDRPNIVVILTDDQPLGRLDAMPNVQALIRDRGADFTQAMTPIALCAPSRAALLTGRGAQVTGVFGNSGASGGWRAFNGNGQERQSLPVWLQNAGYRTALVGKYLNGFRRSTPGYVPPGWDDFSARTTGGYYYDYTLRIGWPGGVREHSYGSAPWEYSTDVFAGMAEHEVELTPSDQPLFLMFAPAAPHGPWTPAPRDVGTWTKHEPVLPDVVEADLSDKPAWLQSQPEKDLATLAARVEAQHETLMSVDDAVSRIVEALGDRASNTLFVFTSDNGLMLGSHRLVGKDVAYQRSTRVPLLMRWDGHLAAGTVDDRIATNVDVTATILDAAGVRQPTDGHSLLAKAARGGSLVEALRSTAIGRPAFCGWRTRHWLYVQYANHRGRELYDYRTDPFELQNLAYDRAYRSQLQLMRANAVAACDPTPPGFRW